MVLNPVLYFAIVSGSLARLLRCWSCVACPAPRGRRARDRNEAGPDRCLTFFRFRSQDRKLSQQSVGSAHNRTSSRYRDGVVWVPTETIRKSWVPGVPKMVTFWTGKNEKPACQCRKGGSKKGEGPKSVPVYQYADTNIKGESACKKASP